MNDFLQRWEQRLTPEQIARLDRIYEPAVVGVPLADSRRALCVLADGEIRAYGNAPDGAPGEKEYLASRDGGISWERHAATGAVHACSYLPKEQVYLTLRETDRGTFVLRSAVGPDDPEPEWIRVSDLRCSCGFLPLQSAYGNRIWFTAQSGDTPVFFFSDDGGDTWNERILPTPWRFETVFPHKGLRWCRGSGSEPCAAETGPGKMMMLIRTPTDCFWQSESSDGGDTWTEPHPTDFYGTDTTPFLLHLSDGQTAAFWNNTKPLSQPNLAVAVPSPRQSVLEGRSENAFTNRDAAHAAISDDGQVFLGRREILLNPIRNRSDFRYIGGTASSPDKSVHQFQALEVPRGKILVSVGQNRAARRMLLLDPRWLRETSRKEDFLSGLEGLTTHTYLKSVSGSHFRQVGNGHCAWNRTHNAYPMPDPDGGWGEALLICKQHDEKRINDIGGAVWNFPASAAGTVTAEIRIVEKQARFVLTDRWYNTCDPYAPFLSPFWFELDAADTGGGFAKVKIVYDTARQRAEVSVDGKPIFTVRQNGPCPAGISYLILQCACDGDSKGFYLRKLEKTAPRPDAAAETE